MPAWAAIAGRMHTPISSDFLAYSAPVFIVEMRSARPPSENYSVGRHGHLVGQCLQKVARDFYLVACVFAPSHTGMVAEDAVGVDRRVAEMLAVYPLVYPSLA